MELIEKLQEPSKEEAHSSEEVLEALPVDIENEVSDPQAEIKVEGTRKRKEADSEELDEAAKTKIIKKSAEAADEGKDSPPSHLSSAGADDLQ